MKGKVGPRVVEQDFHGNFQVNVTCFFAFFSGVLDRIVLILVWFERCLHSARISGQSCPCPSPDDVTSGRRDVDPHGRLRGEGVKLDYFSLVSPSEISCRRVAGLSHLTFFPLW